MSNIYMIALSVAVASVGPTLASAQYLPAPSATEDRQEDSDAVIHGKHPATDQDREREAEREAGPLKPITDQPDAQDPGENVDPEHDGHPGRPQGRE